MGLLRTFADVSLSIFFADVLLASAMIYMFVAFGLFYFSPGVFFHSGVTWSLSCDDGLDCAS